MGTSHLTGSNASVSTPTNSKEHPDKVYVKGCECLHCRTLRSNVRADIASKDEQDFSEVIPDILAEMSRIPVSCRKQAVEVIIAWAGLTDVDYLR